jgi:hypothetical protein
MRCCPSLQGEKTAESDRDELLGRLIRRTGIDQMATYGTKQVKRHREEQWLPACRALPSPDQTPRRCHQGTIG